MSGETLEGAGEDLLHLFLTDSETANHINPLKTRYFENISKSEITRPKVEEF
jgi:hypothetical protein